MSLRSAMDRIVAIEGGLAITSPVVMTVKKAYKFIPPGNVAMPDLPAIFNTWTLTGIEQNPSLRTLHYQVAIQCLVGRATIEDDRVADISTAFWEVALDDFGADLSLDGNVTISKLRGGDPTLVIIERVGQAYIGWQGFLDLVMTSAFTFS